MTHNVGDRIGIKYLSTNKIYIGTVFDVVEFYRGSIAYYINVDNNGGYFIGFDKQDIIKPLHKLKERCPCCSTAMDSIFTMQKTYHACSTCNP